ncbi:MAG: three-Cys-motif partner protein TcmP [Clostridia bacterium]|nr:three-Cys-motif partner protein TcmP [Clostridia bacterium]
MSTKQSFGGAWTIEKLSILSDYLDFYVTALKNQPFQLIYIDAFAGTGKIRMGDTNEEIDGSAKLALQAKERFAEYIFIEKNKEYANELKQMVTDEFPTHKSRVKIVSDDCNTVLLDICNKVDWKKVRAVLFLDPYAADVKWETLQAIAATGAIDVWYLFPFNAVNRMMKKKGDIDPSWKKKLNSILGDGSWETEFYKEDPQISLFDTPGTHSMIRTASTASLKTYIENRLRTVFSAVSQHSRILYNSRNSPLFLFCFAVSNKNPTAQRLAMKVADHILKNDK